eukprot:2021601-Amphidinium_carterae.1
MTCAFATAVRRYGMPPRGALLPLSLGMDPCSSLRIGQPSLRVRRRRLLQSLSERHAGSTMRAAWLGFAVAELTHTEGLSRATHANCGERFLLSLHDWPFPSLAAWNARSLFQREVGAANGGVVVAVSPELYASCSLEWKVLMAGRIAAIVLERSAVVREFVFVHLTPDTHSTWLALVDVLAAAYQDTTHLVVIIGHVSMTTDGLRVDRMGSPHFESALPAQVECSYSHARGAYWSYSCEHWLATYVWHRQGFCQHY